MKGNQNIYLYRLFPAANMAKIKFILRYTIPKLDLLIHKGKAIERQLLVSCY